MVDFQLTPEEINQYETRKSSARQSYQLGLSRNIYERGILDQNFAASSNDFSRKMDDLRKRLPGNFLRRGVFNSGIYAQGLQDYAQNRQLGMADLLRKYQQSQGEYALRDQELEMGLQQQLQQIDAEQVARRAALAAALREIM